MARARALVAAVPPRVWLAVACLALLASVGIGTVIGAGLSAWRGAVGTTASAPRVVISPPSSSLVVVPSPQGSARPAARPAAPVPAPVAARAQRAAVVTRPAVRPAPAKAPVSAPASRPVAPQVQPSPAPPGTGTGSGQAPRLVRAAASHDHGRHLGWQIGRRGAPAAARSHGARALVVTAAQLHGHHGRGTGHGGHGKHLHG